MQPENLPLITKGQRSVPDPMDGSDRRAWPWGSKAVTVGFELQWWEEASGRSRIWRQALKNQDDLDQQKGGETFSNQEGSW